MPNIKFLFQRWGFNKLTITDLKSYLTSHSINQKCKIVVIDDNIEGEIASFVKILKSAGYDITIKEDLDEYENVAAHDLIICDNMGVGLKLLDGRGNGQQLLKIIRQKYPEKYLILFSGEQIPLRYVDQQKKYCDEAWDKNQMDLDAFRDHINKCIPECNNPEKRWLNMRIALLNENFSIHKIAMLEHYYVLSIMHKDPKLFCKKIENIKDNNNEKIITILDLAINIVTKCITA